MKSLQHYLKLSLLSVFIAGVSCEEQNQEHSSPMGVQTSDATLLGFGGCPKVVTISDNEQTTWFRAEFDEKGRCLKWNDTGIFDEEEVAEEVSGRQRVLSQHSRWEFAMDFAWYEYRYNQKGRLCEVIKHSIWGENEHYLITYSSHRLWTVAPFPLGGLRPYLLQGVESITSARFNYQFDGKRATARRIIPEGLPPEIQLSEFEFDEGGRVTDVYTTTYVDVEGTMGTKLRKEHHLYQYTSKGILKSMTEVTTNQEEQQEHVITDFDTSHPLHPLTKRHFAGVPTSLKEEMQFTYTSKGLLWEAKYTTGENFFLEMPLQHQYSDVDRHGNWTNLRRTIEGETFLYKQQIDYHP